MIVVILHPKPSFTITDEKVIDLPWLQDQVGGYIEGVALSPDVMAYINEDGKEKGLPVNPIADNLWKGSLLARNMRANDDDFIVGTMVIVGINTITGESRGLSEHELGALGGACSHFFHHHAKEHQESS